MQVKGVETKRKGGGGRRKVSGLLPNTGASIGGGVAHLLSVKYFLVIGARELLLLCRARAPARKAYARGSLRNEIAPLSAAHAGLIGSIRRTTFFFFFLPLSPFLSFFHSIYPA